MTNSPIMDPASAYSKFDGDGDIIVATKWGKIRLHSHCVDVVVDKESYLVDGLWHVRVPYEVKFYSTTFPCSRIARSIARQVSLITGKLGTTEVADWVQYDFVVYHDDEDELQDAMRCFQA